MEHTKYVDLWLDMNKVEGFLIPFNRETEEQDSNTVNLIYQGDIMTVKQEPHVMNYLAENFMEVAKEAKPRGYVDL
jgi:hypothetical protein